MRCKTKSLFLFSLLLATLSLLCQDAYAVFDFSVSPRRGGQNIRFQASHAGVPVQSEEVQLSVMTDKGAAYRIFSTLNQPLINEFGNTIPQGALFMFSPSSTLGTLRVQLETPVVMGQTPIYTSNSSGDSDSFFLVFNIQVPENQPGGMYYTQISFSVEPVDSAGAFSPIVRTLDVQVEITPSFKIEVKSQKGGRQIELGRIDEKNNSSSEALVMEVTSNIGARYRIIQQLAEPLVSSEGSILEEDTLQFSVSGGRNGSVSTGSEARALLTDPIQLYTSNPSGEGDAFQIQYAFTPHSRQKAGIYSGTLLFRAESDSPLVSNEVINLPIKIKVEPVFNLAIEIKDELGIHFGIVKPGEDKKEKQVSLVVKSNLGEPYQISQIASRKLGTPEGHTLPSESLLYYGQKTRTGDVKALSPIPLPDGESIIFVSDKLGTPEELSMNYSLSIPIDSPPGSYTSEIKYSITTL
jgi:hypothetical protein